MEKKFINTNGVIRIFYVVNGKVMTTIEIDGQKVVNPTLEQFIASGWTPYEIPEDDPQS